MGFALWIEKELAWAAGTYEYRPFGAAVISRTDLFRQRDFDVDRKPPPLGDVSFAGYFASLGDVNAYLKAVRSEQGPVRPTNTPGTKRRTGLRCSRVPRSAKAAKARRQGK